MLTANDEYFVGKGMYEETDNPILYSSDGITWSRVTGHGLSGLAVMSDISWDGQQLFTLRYGHDIRATKTKNGKSNWRNIGDSPYIANEYYEQFKYGGNYYVKKGYGKSNIVRSATNIQLSGYTPSILPLSRNSALNYGPGYWLILTQCGDLMKSSDSSASDWTIIDGSDTDTQSSSLYQKSNKSNWCGICYGDCYGGCWVAYTVTGDVAVLYDITSKIKFSSTTVHTDQEPVNAETTYTFIADEITGGTEGNYYIDFEIVNVKLISATYSCPVAKANADITKEVYDVINFGEDLNGKNGILNATSWSGSVSNGVYVVNSASNARITAQKHGNIKLTVVPTSETTNGKIKQKYGTNTDEKTISRREVITINGCDMNQSGTEYYMDFSVTGLSILSAIWEPAPEKLPVPKRSSVIDCRASNLSYNSNLVGFGTNMNGTRENCSWFGAYQNTRCWKTNASNYLFDMMPYSKNDSYFYFFDTESSSIVKGNGTNENPSASVSGLLTLDTLTRVYFDAKENWPAAGIGRATDLNYRYLPLAGFTQPINTVLYNYINNGLSTNAVMDNYVNPTNDFNRTALRQLTSDACTKLKNSGARIYVIKYRAQKNWGALTRTSTNAYGMTSVPHNYTEIEACATSTGGKLYDNISNESQLQNALTEIAADIKTWADYKPAKAQ